MNWVTSHLMILVLFVDYYLDRQHAAVIQKNFIGLKDSLIPDRIIDHLYSKRAFDHEDFADAKQPHTVGDKVEVLMLYLMRKPVMCYNLSRNALIEDEQQHVLQFLPEIEPTTSVSAINC